jgi:hypothetical protein
MIPEFSEIPISHLNDDLSNGYAMGAYDVMGDRLLSDHIGYRVGTLAPYSRLNVKLPSADGGSHWSATLICSSDGGRKDRPRRTQR